MENKCLFFNLLCNISKKNTIISVLCSFLSVISLGISFCVDCCFWDDFVFSVLSSVVLFFIFFLFYLKFFGLNINKREFVFAIVLSIFISLDLIIGHSFKHNNSFEITYSLTTWTKSFVKFLGYTLMLFCVIILLYKILFPKFCNFKIKQHIFPTVKIRDFVVIWVVIFVFQFQYLLKYYPGNVPIDAMWQMVQATGCAAFEDHHPVFHTFLIKIVLNVVQYLGGTINDAIFTFAVLQSFALYFVFAYVINLSVKLNIPLIFRFLFLTFFALYPFGTSAANLMKDCLFGVFFVFFAALLLEFLCFSDDFFSNRIKVVGLIMSALLFSLVRHNGIYVFVLTMPFVILFLKKHRTKTLFILVSVVCLFGLSKFFIHNIFNIPHGPLHEKLSVPLQQFARLYVDKGDIDLQETIKFEKFIDISADSLAKCYRPHISDPVKSHFKDDYYVEHKTEFYYLWIKSFFIHPKVFVDAFINLNYGYWYPEKIESSLLFSGIMKNGFNAYQTPHSNFVADFFVLLLKKTDIPLLKNIFSIGFFFINLCVIFVYCLVRKKYGLIPFFALLFSLWLTCIASPCFFFRYALALFMAYPLLFMCIFPIEKKNNTDYHVKK